MRTTTRRRALASTVAAGAALAGCLGGSGGSGLSDHPAATGIDAQPSIGPDPSTADAVIVAFEDPSCPSCARFEYQTFPRIESELVSTGKAAFVFRGLAVVRQWSTVATPALEAVYARNPSAFWGLKNFYYRYQSQITTENVADATTAYLGDQTDLDTAAVQRDVREGAYRSAVSQDNAAAQDAGVRGTPTFFLFRDGAFATEVVGPQGYETFASALGY